jgi:hypothetical protein
MRCGGCGAKVGATTLERALARIQADQRAAQGWVGLWEGQGGGIAGLTACTHTPPAAPTWPVLIHHHCRHPAVLHRPACLGERPVAPGPRGRRAVS